MINPAFIPDDFFKVLAPSDIFGADGPFEVDLGCGDGGFLLQMAAHYPERRFLGIERLLGRVRGVCSRAAVRGLDNVKVFRVESRYFLEWMMQPGCISRLHYLCPDPWPKERHHKNRLVQEDFLDFYTGVKRRYAIPDGLLELEFTGRIFSVGTGPCGAQRSV